MLRLKRRIEELESHAVIQGNKTNHNPHEHPHNKDINNVSNIHNIHNNIGEASQVQAAQGNEQNNSCTPDSASGKAGTRTELFSQGQNPATPISPARTQHSMRNPSVTDRVSSETPIGSIGSLESYSVNSDFFGGSSAVSFLSQMRNAVHQKLGISDATIPGAPEDLQKQILGAPAMQRYKQIHYVLPGRRQADKLLSVYWNNVHPLYPFLDKRKFLAQYETLWVHQESDQEDPVFLCALNLLFALSSQLNGDVCPNDRHSSADGFFERAKESLDLWHLNTLQSVQMLLLLSIYLQSTCALNQSWMITGVAIRTAQSLGLHLYETGRRFVSQEERELARKVWHTCVLMDRMVAMTYGRPPMTTARIETKAHMPQSVDEDFHPTEDHRPMPYPGQPSTVDFFSQSLRLFEILDEILGEFYSDQLEKGCPSGDVLETLLGRTTADKKWFMLDIDKKLLEWDNKLPSHLKVKHTSLSSSFSCTFTRQATILRQQLVSA